MARRFSHNGRVVEAIRFVGNGPDVARFAGAFGRAFGFGLGGELRIGGQEVETGDWVIRDGVCVAVVSQVQFASGKFVEVRHADQQ